MSRKKENYEKESYEKEAEVFEESALDTDTSDNSADLDAEQLAELLLKMGKEKEEAEERTLRMQADFDNFRKRTRQEKEDLTKYANTDLFKALLPVADNMERAVEFYAAGEENAASLADGMRMISRQLTGVFESFGLLPIDAMGTDFNPELHEAVMQEDAGEELSGKVVMELQRGYTLNGRLLRPSMVKVGQ